ncbi:hypothetical protein BC830DRAFT_761236 [Chytriomyces sp. MP71]|nr:hypothetical protein BC830DRAFT_761236 [Chytriomyces sp. MP71]
MFLYYRTCLETLIFGINKATILTSIATSNNATSKSIIDNSLTYPDTSVTGNISFAPNSTDRLGVFEVKFWNKTSFVDIGSIDENLRYTVEQPPQSLGWFNPSTSEPLAAVQSQVTTNTGLVVGISVLGGLLFLTLVGLLVHCCYFRRSDVYGLKLNEEEVNQTNNTNPELNVNGTGQQALNILARLKNQTEQHQRTFLTSKQIQILTDALTSFGNSAYLPNFEQDKSQPIDRELQEFLMNTMLAQTKRTAVVDGDILQHMPTQMATNFTDGSGSSGEQPAALGIPMMHRVPSLYERFKKRNQSIKSNTSTDAIQIPQIPEVPHLKPEIATSPDKPRSFSAIAIPHDPEPLSLGIKMLRQNSADSVSKMSLPAIKAKDTIPVSVKRSPTTVNIPGPIGAAARKMSTFAMAAFSPPHMTASPTKNESEHGNMKEGFLSASGSLMSIVVPDLTKQFQDNPFIVRPTLDLQRINSGPILEYLNDAYLTWSIGN